MNSALVVISFVTFVFTAYLISLLLKQRRVRPLIRNTFLLVVLSPLIYSIVFLVEDSRPDLSIPLFRFLSVSVHVGGIMVAFLFLCMTRYFRVKNVREFVSEFAKKPYYLFYIYVIVFLATIAAAAYISSDYLEGGLADRISFTPYRILTYMTLGLYIILPTHLVWVYSKKYHIDSHIKERMMLLLLAFIGVGVTSHIFSNTLIIQGFKLRVLEIFYYLFFILMVSYALRESGLLYRFHLPLSEGDISGKPGYNLEQGHSYVFMEEKPVVGYEAFVDYVTHGIAGLCFTQSDPREIKSDYGLEKTPVIWVTTEAPSDVEFIHPDASDLVLECSSLSSRGDNAIVFIDCLLYILQSAGFEDTIGFLDELIAEVEDSRGRLILSVNPKDFEFGFLRALEERFIVVHKPVPKGLESTHDRILRVLGRLQTLEDIHACMVAHKGLEGVTTITEEFKSEVVGIWDALKGTIDELFDVIDHYTEYGLDKVYFEIGEFDAMFFILPGSDTALVAVVPALANRGLLEVELENARREIIKIVERE